jgi:betaine-aldehyde dehydrogenase
MSNSASSSSSDLRSVTSPTLFISNRWRASSTKQTRPTINPFDGSVIQEISEASAADAEEAILSARKFFDTDKWCDHTVTRIADRVRSLERIAELLQAHKDELARVETIDTGKTFEEGKVDVDDVTNVFRFYAKEALKFDQEKRVKDAAIPESAKSIITHQPVGVCVLITPWNYVSWR